MFDYLKHRLIVILFCLFIIIKVLAHEMGHNFGMLHDFDETHGGTGDYSTSTNDCNNKGIMSYGDGVPTEWSSCSVSDFTGSYNSNGWGDKCLASKNNNIWITNSFTKDDCISAYLTNYHFTIQAMMHTAEMIAPHVLAWVSPTFAVTRMPMVDALAGHNLTWKCIVKEHAGCAKNVSFDSSVSWWIIDFIFV